MKPRSFALAVWFSLALGLAATFVVTQPASAACYDSSKNPVPCTKDQKKVPPTPIPQQSAAGLAATVPVAVQSIVIATPNPDQLKAMCANLPAPAGGAATGPGSGPGVTGPTGAGGNGGFTGPVTYGVGLGGLLLGILIGLVIPPALNRRNGTGRSLSGGPMQTEEAWQTGGNVMGAGGGPADKQAEAGALFIKHDQGGLTSMPVEDAVQTLMMELSNDAHQDARDQLSQMEADRQRRDASGGQGSSQPTSPASVSKGVTAGSELGDAQQHALQQHQDANSSLDQTVSNALKRAEDTSDGISGNPK